jgi:hypothetical protein
VIGPENPTKIKEIITEPFIKIKENYMNLETKYVQKEMRIHETKMDEGADMDAVLAGNEMEGYLSMFFDEMSRSVNRVEVFFEFVDVDLLVMYLEGVNDFFDNFLKFLILFMNRVNKFMFNFVNVKKYDRDWLNVQNSLNILGLKNNL